MKKMLRGIIYLVLIFIFVLCLMTMTSLIFDNLFINFFKDIIVIVILILDSVILMLYY